jgi:hypothetical protein
VLFGRGIDLLDQNALELVPRLQQLDDLVPALPAAATEAAL